MELRQIKYFLALSRTLNFTRAAEECRVTQPTLTQSIKKLEEELGGQLLLRQRNRTHLTHLGQMILPFLEQVYESSEAAQMIAEDLSRGDRTPVRIGVSDAFNIAHLLQPVSEIKRSVPGLELHVIVGPDEQLSEMALDGHLDLTIISQASTDEKHFRFMSLYTEVMRVAVKGDSTLAGREIIDLSDLDDQHCICLKESDIHSDFVSFASKNGVNIAQQHWAKRSSDAQMMVLADLGVALVGDREALVDGVVTRKIGQPIPMRTIGLAELRGKPLSGAVLALSRQLRAKHYPAIECPVESLDS
ncbi:LysR family transcriptional regulator [Roseibium sp. TrichSKD4]|uniref:LysR family transcriptional regulator n=1 Tax=Roseibium sp. TrichSKD4 TaxID=744980 RepID=UPI0001E5775A|nr:LysR family transcriptional regulator [Roseibium sp. TrichSKD4]EFO28865.1 LysR family transcriptional regulator [Roseibium sp. TrichSKD4]